MTTSLAQHVEAAAESVRAANHAAHEPLTGPGAHDVVGSLAELVRRLPQLLGYLARGLRRADPAEHFDDRGQDPATALCHAHSHLADARGLVDDLARQLDQAHNHLGHLGRHISED